LTVGSVVVVMMRSLIWRLALYRRKSRFLDTFVAIVLLFIIYAFFSPKWEETFEVDDLRHPAVKMKQRKMVHVIPNYLLPREGPGEKGEAVDLSPREAALGRDQMKTWFMNVVASDKISPDRSIPDSRSEACIAKQYDKELPNASVVIIFTDEAWSPLLRTVHSVINRSPLHLLHEVILVDDFSQREELKGKLDSYMERFGGVVHVLRLKERQGLIRAKLEGAKAARGEVLVFLDSHCEANQGWLEPLLQRIKDKRSAVVCPTIDAISDSTMQYLGGRSAGHQRWPAAYWQQIGSISLKSADMIRAWIFGEVKISKYRFG
uniref:Polypeptide N-acetylgalactosaminyltransferase n=1 Tax=Parascaris univalens TaxID=6257 RepID=A0A914ZUK7_PARUN